MLKYFLSIGAAAIICSGATAAPVFPKESSTTPYEKLIKRQKSLSQKQWAKGALQSKQQRIVREEPDGSLPTTSSWGSLFTPNGETWLYTSDFTYTAEGSIEKVHITIYDADLNEYSSVDMDLQLGENETSINSVEVDPTITKKFFNYDDYYEIMVFIHATTVDYAGHSYTKVFSLKDGKHLGDFEGNNIARVNTAIDQWSENFTMVFMREAIDEDWNYSLLFDVYKKAGWGGSPTLEHTFEVDYATFAGAGEQAFPFMVATRNGNEIFYALPSYEKPFFTDDDFTIENPEATPDNNFLIKLYDSSFNLVKITSIPMSTKEGYLYSFPGVGELSGFDDMTFGMFDDSDMPVYIIGMENYVPSSDDFVCDFYVYDSDGNLIKTIMEDAEDYLNLSDIAGQEKQVCFYKDGVFQMVDIPLCKVVATVDPLVAGEGSLTTSFDRAARGNSYLYVSSVNVADTDQSGNAIHKIAWMNSDGSLKEVHAINLGKDVALALPYISQEAFDPFIFNTDSDVEYMFLVKQFRNAAINSRTDEILRIYGQTGNKLLEVGPDAEIGILNSIFLMNPTQPNAKLIVTYLNEDDYTCTIKHFNLPLMKFAGGEGTEENPYLVASMGDLTKLYTEPSAHFAIVADIDCGGSSFPANPGVFTGTLEGRGHTISNMVLGQGLFEFVSGKARIKSIKISDSTFEGDNEGAFIAASASGESANIYPLFSDIHIYDCHASGNNSIFGAIVGTASLYTKVSGCVVKNSEFNFDGDAVVGGIIGNARTSSAVNACAVIGHIQGYLAGGIIGETSKGDENVSNCHVDASIVGERSAGGIIGESNHSTIEKCYAEGSIEATSASKAYAGGIVGYMEKTYNEDAPIAVHDNIVALESVIANPKASSSIAHRIVGYSSVDFGEIDWDNVTEGMSPEDYPYLPGKTETGIANNYAIGLAVIDVSIEDAHNTTEGESIQFVDLTDAFLAERGWAFGEIIAEPWVKGENSLSLYFEDRGPTVGIESVGKDPIKTQQIKFNGYQLVAEGNIDVYNIAGVKMAAGNSPLIVENLANGTYVARSGEAVLKFAIK